LGSTIFFWCQWEAKNNYSWEFWFPGASTKTTTKSYHLESAEIFVKNCNLIWPHLTWWYLKVD
jgi:hypothetical protein